MFRMTRFVLFLALAMPAMSGNVSAENPKERIDEVKTFVSQLGNDARSILGNSDIEKSAKQKQFEAFIDERFDMRGIGRFVLGRWWQEATPSQKTHYLRLFRKSVIVTYFDILEDYADRQLKVTRARVKKTRSGHYFIVQSRIVDEDPNKAAVKVDWRVFPYEDSFRVVDVVIEGVSTAITQRSEYASVIKGNGGDVQALINALEKQVEQHQANAS